jgi:hypothetical protein
MGRPEKYTEYDYTFQYDKDGYLVKYIEKKKSKTLSYFSLKSCRRKLIRYNSIDGTRTMSEFVERCVLEQKFMGYNSFITLKRESLDINSKYYFPELKKVIILRGKNIISFNFSLNNNLLDKMKKVVNSI